MGAKKARASARAKIPNPAMAKLRNQIGFAGGISDTDCRKPAGKEEPMRKGTVQIPSNS